MSITTKLNQNISANRSFNTSLPLRSKAGFPIFKKIKERVNRHQFSQPFKISCSDIIDSFLNEKEILKREKLGKS